MHDSNRRSLEYHTPARGHASERRAWWGLAITLIACLVAVLLAPVFAWVFWLLGQWK
jgi:hypothetical protein